MKNTIVSLTIKLAAIVLLTLPLAAAERQLTTVDLLLAPTTNTTILVIDPSASGGVGRIYLAVLTNGLNSIPVRGDNTNTVMVLINGTNVLMLSSNLTANSFTVNTLSAPSASIQNFVVQTQRTDYLQFTNLNDAYGSNGIVGQFLGRQAAGALWSDLPAASAIKPYTNTFIAFLGDSLTAGAAGQVPFPYFLSNRLESLGLIYATNGATAGDTIEQQTNNYASIEPWEPLSTGTNGVVSFRCGINNLATDAFLVMLGKLTNAIGFLQSRGWQVVGWTITDSLTMPAAERAGLRTNNATLIATLEAMNVPVVDVHSWFPITDKETTVDGVHYTTAVNEKIADLLYDRLTGHRTPGAAYPISVLGIDASYNLTVKSNVTVGSTADGAVATPTYLSLGGTYGSNPPGDPNNLKLRLYDDGSSLKYGFGLSLGLIEFSAGDSTHLGGYGWWTSGTNAMHLTKAGLLGVNATNVLAPLQIGDDFQPVNTVYNEASRLRIFGRLPNSITNEVLLRLVRAENELSTVYYGATADFKMNSWGPGGAGDGYAPKSRLTLALKNASSFNEAADVDVLSLLSSGAVGVNTNSPQAALHVNGSLWMEKNLISVPRISNTNIVWGDFTAHALVSVTNSSSVQLNATNLVPGGIVTAFVWNTNGTYSTMTYGAPAGVEMVWPTGVTNMYVTNVMMVNWTCINSNLVVIIAAGK